MTDRMQQQGADVVYEGNDWEEDNVVEWEEEEDGKLEAGNDEKEESQKTW